MSTITTIQSTDKITDSRAVINTNFSNLNTDKMEKSANLSDVAVKATAQNNLLPAQTGENGKVLGTDGANVAWVDPSGASKASAIVIGITALSVAPANANLPNAVGDNDPRMPTQGEKDAMAGTGTPTTANPFVTKDTDDLKELLTNKSTTTTLGTSNTLYPTQNAVKTYVDGLGYLSAKTGTLSIDLATATTSTIPHGLGRTPKLVRLSGTIGGNSSYAWSNGSYDGTTQNCVFLYGLYNGNDGGGPQVSTSKIARIQTSSANYISGVATIDSTSITIVWTKNNSPTGTTDFIWEAIG
jgi:hypothetical protein